MAQIINDLDLGSYLGRQLGGGLSSALDTLAKFKMNEMMQRQQQQRTGQAYKQLGIPEATSLLPENLQKMYLANYLQENPESFGQLMQQQVPTEEMARMQPMQQTTEQQMLNQMNNMLVPQKTSPYQAQEGMMNALNQRMQQPLEPQEYAQQGMQKPIRTARSAQQYNIPAGLNRAQRAAFLRDAVKNEKLERMAIDKENRPVIKEIVGGYKAAVDQNKDLDKMEKLIETKNLSRPRFHSLLNALEHGLFGFGVDFHSLETPESQQFTKLSNQMLKNAKSIFGSRLTDADVKAFLKMVPTLSQSREGKRQIINNMRIYNAGAMTKKKIMDDILKENNGRAPRNLDTLIEERAKPILDELAIQFDEKPEKISKQSRSLFEKIQNPYKTFNPLTHIWDVVLGKG